MKLDHLLYITERSYRRARNAELHRFTGGGGLFQMNVVHEANESCCRIEPWPITFARLIEALNADGLKTAGVVTDVDGWGMLLPTEGVEA